VNNASLARSLRRAADLLDLHGASSFRVQAYRNAARSVEAESRALSEQVDDGVDLTRIPGIGKEMAAHIGELVERGALAFAEELAAEIPASLIDVAALPGVGAARARQFQRELGIVTVEALEAAARTGRVRRLAGFGAASQARILASIEQRRAEAAELAESEIDAAAGEARRGLLEVGHIRGDLHMHSTWSDGHDGIEEMVAACAARGYDFMALTDHSRSLKIAGGLDVGDLNRQRAEVERVRKRHPELQILHGAEVEILPDGSLDYDEDVLARLDVVVAAVHSRFTLPAAEQTARVLRALERGTVDVLAHPTGRKIGRRPPMRFDLEAILRCAAEHEVAVELNALPQRMDLTVRQLERARELGVKVAIGTDAHRVDGLELMTTGVAHARRAGLRKPDVLNAMKLKPLLRFLRGRRKRMRSA
jgi:histidinol phosphatase-like PHP family hydrolase